jgi:hypothetical protein
MALRLEIRLHQCLELFSQHYPNQFHWIQVDQSGAHTAQQLEPPDNIRLIFQPVAAPPVNPGDRK